MAKILIVDDAEVQRFQLSFALKKAGYEVVEGTDGQNGLDQLAVNPDVALIICDVHMPVMDGLAMCAEIQKSPELTHPPVIMLTTEASTDLKTTAKANNVRAWIIKPFTADKLLAGIKAILEAQVV